MLAVCLAFIVAALAVMVRLRPAWIGIFARMLAAGRTATIRTDQPGGPSLAELCLLRT